MNFIEAFQKMKEGVRVSRRAWKKKATVYIVHNKLNNFSHVEVRKVGNCMMYAASSEDLLATDWHEMNEEVREVNPLQEQEIVL